MMKKVLALLAILACAARGETLVEKYAPQGKLIIAPFDSAPFPHPARKDGHTYRTNFLSAAEHYQNSTVVMFVPKNFHPGSHVDFLVHFHGWGNNATNAIGKYHLIDQFAASRRNAILIVPQGPFNAQDSFDGKLEDAGGFERFMAEAMATLRANHVIKGQKVGDIILSGHSGGYEAISSIVAWGGLNSHIREVWLFDALYANTERFVTWFDHHHGSRFIDLYTDHGGTLDETQHLIAALQGNGVRLFTGTDVAAKPRQLSNPLVFLHTDLPHDRTVDERGAFQQYLETSVFDRLRR